MIKTLKQAEHKQQLELNKQFYVIYGAAMCVLQELYGFRNKRIWKTLQEADRIFKKQASDGEYSMPELCERETKMVMKRGDKTYKSCYLLNSEEWWKRDQGFTEPQKIYNIEEANKWIPQIMEACLLTAIHRTEGWGYKKRLPEFLENVDGVRNECRTADYYKKLMECNYNTGFILRK